MSARPMLFDLDGTLVDTLADIQATANHLRGEFGLPPVDAGRVRGWIGDGALELVRRALRELGPFEPLHAKAWEIYFEHHARQCTQRVQPYPGVREHLAGWRAEGRPLAVVTNKPGDFAERILVHLELRDAFGACVYGDSLAARKPDPAPLREALRRLGCSGESGVMVGDGVQDLRAGKACGLGTVAALFGFEDEDVLRAEGADAYWRGFGVAAKP